jgi:hypothetical protein
MLVGNMPVFCLILLSLLGLSACQDPAPVAVASRTLPPQRNHLEEMAGFSINVPDNWSEHDDGVVQLLHGPAGTDAFYATLAIQRRVALTEQRLDEAVALALAVVSREAGFVWDSLVLDVVGQDLALGYGVRFNALEVSHRQTGLVFVHNGVLVAMTLSAPTDLFDSVIPVFQRAVDSLSMLPEMPRPRAQADTHLGVSHPTRPPR